MIEIKLSDSEMKFMNLIWDNAPINSTELVRIVEASLGWKKSTTYTVLRRLSQRGILKNENAVVSYLVEREEVQQTKGDEILGKIYGGSIKMFLASFLNKNKISKKEAKELANMIEEYIDKDE
ncbi:MAG TPA: BlaI/MecI/CopY family transcriptional regulator [Tissierellales bacterium]|nr:BlaI/MecI/CopY family transcriptional regulator [uncultured Romboutsia sp.]HLR35696.1 BlaI/MecI/CopY family transcriptional regulator [Tissierellales bacterium]